MDSSLSVFSEYAFSIGGSDAVCHAAAAVWEAGGALDGAAADLLRVVAVHCDVKGAVYPCGSIILSANHDMKEEINLGVGELTNPGYVSAFSDSVARTCC